MRVLTRHVVIENEEFVLIKDKTNDGKDYYGTIPYTELDNEGKMKRGLNGFEMRVSFDGVADAIRNRKRGIIQERLISEYMADGLDKDKAIIMAVLNAN